MSHDIGPFLFQTPVIYTGTAGWNIPRLHRTAFESEGSQLRRYASRLNCAEINTSFYRPHTRATYERWAAAVPASFRFAVKMPKAISHEQGLARSRLTLERFLGEVSALGPRLGPLLLQLPPKFAFDGRRVGRFFELLRARHPGLVVCEPRNETWTSPAAERLLERFQIARVAADPPRADRLGEPGGWNGLAYYRWHGSPRPYFSPYLPGDLDRLARLAGACAADVWCIFDNTGSGAAAGDALALLTRLTEKRPPEPTGTRA